eukprot:1161933-Pelagomonas_calceolata.AAC.4
MGNVAHNAAEHTQAHVADASCTPDDIGAGTTGRCNIRATGQKRNISVLPRSNELLSLLRVRTWSLSFIAQLLLMPVGSGFIALLRQTFHPHGCRRRKGTVPTKKSAQNACGGPDSLCLADAPKKGRVADPGLTGQALGKGMIMWPPVSVCHQVSTMGHLRRVEGLWHCRKNELA